MDRAAIDPLFERADAAQHLTIQGSQLPFSSCVRIGRLLLLSGQIGVDASGRLLTGLTAQVPAMIHNIRQALRLAGGDLHNIVKCTVMLRDIGQWSTFNALYLDYFDLERLPARSAFGGVSLALGAEVEMECIAYLPEEPHNTA